MTHELLKFTPNEDFQRRFDKPYVFVKGQEYELPSEWVNRIIHLVTIVKPKGVKNGSGE